MAKSPVTGESTKETVKTIACGNAGCSGGPVVTTLVCFLHFAREAAGAAGTRHSPRPLLGERLMHDSGASRRGNAELFLMNTNAPHFQSSSPATAGDPVFQNKRCEIERPLRTGYPACAGYDGS